MGFHEIQFPVDIAYGTAGGPGFSTEIVETDSGKEQRIANWSQPRHIWNAAYAVRSYAQLQIVKNFFNARLGSANGFRFKDFFDFTTHTDGKSAHTKTDQPIATGNGTLVKFQLIKQYLDAEAVRTFKITKPVASSVLVDIDGATKTEPADFTTNTATGEITFGVAPGNGAIIKAGCEFDKPVRFGADIDSLLQADYENFGSGSISDIPLIELIDEVPISDEFYYGGAQITDPMESSISLVELNGRVQIVNPNASTWKIFLPDFAALPTGGPWFYIQNISGSFTVSIRDDSDVEVGVIGAGEAMSVWLGLISSTSKKWYGLV